MRVILQQETTFTATFGDRAVYGLARETWHRMDRLTDAQGRELFLFEGKMIDGTPSLLRALGLLKTEPVFIRVLARTLPNGTHVPEFYVAQRKASKGDDGKIVIDADRAPWVNINYLDAIKACEATGQKLLTGEQALSIALDIAEQDINWTGGKVGEGVVYQGLHLGTVRGPQVGTYESPHAEERRWHQLSTGERIWDFSGHVFEWMRDTFHGGENGVLPASGLPANSPYLTVPPFPICKQGMGWQPDGARDWSGGALVRGGFWYSGDDAGLFRLLYWYPQRENGVVGFRCTL